MAKKPSPKKPQPEREDQPELDLGLGSFSLGGILKGLGNLIDLAAKVSEEGKEIQKEGHFELGKQKQLKGVWGISMRTLSGEKPIFQRFGNIVKETPKGPVVEEVREPLVDVFDEKRRLRVIAELPGVTPQEVQTEIKGDILTIKTIGDRKYLKEVLLPAKVVESSLKSEYRNGVLEVTLEKA